ncbi:alpha/beta hydrolase [Sinorhizobium meliloti]|nr:alpha/beta hydrolase [Sinorhizobium meliloti]MDW9527456.1 alpha/beta hydrolase [Sinorhizobium meliloti]MDW9658241.1 alpha/beta hydrolase [Sinorhizobium meliloti]MDW9881332.1 alpha/beta hydrolase [Sinorhizobium meliloti]MDW9918177.1 alpha/beta hydrolase [Sinorhizobium meliloti]
MQELGTGDANARAKAIYDYGQTAIFASRADPRLHMLLYVPPMAADGRKLDLLVAVHGTGRTSAIDFRDGFAEFGLYNDCAILCPIFPVGVLGDDARSGYKFIEEGEIRYDRVVLAMVEEVAAKYGQDWSTFAMFGFSGGGHFTHRFAILHPEKLWAASIGAPGSVTLLDATRDWWVGIRDLEARFGRPFQPQELAKVPVQMVVGDADLETWEITHQPGGRYYMEGANDAGATRPERLAALAKSFSDAGVNVSFERVPGVSHDRIKVLGHVKSFLAKVLKDRRAR